MDGEGGPLRVVFKGGWMGPRDCERATKSHVQTRDTIVVLNGGWVIIRSCVLGRFDGPLRVGWMGTNSLVLGRDAPQKCCFREGWWTFKVCGYIFVPPRVVFKANIHNTFRLQNKRVRTIAKLQQNLVHKNNQISKTVDIVFPL